MVKTILSVFVAMCVFMSSDVYAYNGTIDMTGVTFPMSMCETVAALMLAALAVLWIVRKVLSLTRS